VDGENENESAEQNAFNSYCLGIATQQALFQLEVFRAYLWGIKILPLSRTEPETGSGSDGFDAQMGQMGAFGSDTQ
jgi:hypothetical protein